MLLGAIYATMGLFAAPNATGSEALGQFSCVVAVAVIAVCWSYDVF